LGSITELPGTQVGGALSFIGMEAGPQVTVSPDATTAAGLLGWAHYGPADINTNILPAMGIPAEGSSGFTAPLGQDSTHFGSRSSVPARSRLASTWGLCRQSQNLERSPCR
jgi:hypothetical protein